MSSEELRVKSEELVRVAARRRVCRFPSKFFTLHSSLFTASSGFSLVEVMLAIGIIAFAVVGILTAFPVGIDAARDSRDENTAALIADDLFTRLRSQPFGGTASGGTPFVWPEVPWKSVAQGLKVDYTGWTPIANMFHYTRDGRPANADTSSDGKAPTSSYKGDEGYFGVRIYVNNDPYNPLSNSNLKARDDDSVIYLYELACVIVEVSWPARTPYNNRKFKRQFDSAIANLH